MELCAPLFGQAALHARLIAYDSVCPKGPAGTDGQDATINVDLSLPPDVGALDADKVCDRRVLCTAALKALKESRDNELHGRSLPNQVVFNLCSTRSLDKAAALAKIGASESKELVLFSLDAKALAAVDVSALSGLSGARELGPGEIDFDKAPKESERAQRKLSFAVKYYDLDKLELLEKPLWQLVASRVAAKGV